MRGKHENKSNVWGKVFQIAYVGRDGSLVGLVQHDAGVGRHLRVDQGFSEQHTVRHVLDDRLVAGKKSKKKSSSVSLLINLSQQVVYNLTARPKSSFTAPLNTRHYIKLTRNKS